MIYISTGNSILTPQIFDSLDTLFSRCVYFVNLNPYFLDIILRNKSNIIVKWFIMLFIFKIWKCYKYLVIKIDKNEFNF